MFQPDFINVCFWYIPKNLRALPNGAERDERLGKVVFFIHGLTRACRFALTTFCHQ